MTPVGDVPAHPVAGAVLAAGAGSRMGGPKALLELDHGTLVARAATALLDGGCASVGVVVGARGPQVALELADDALRHVAVIPNPEWDAGLSTSVRAALRWADGTHAEALVLMPVDAPGLGPEVVARVLAARTGPEDALVAAFDGQHRNPVLLGRGRWAAVATALRGDEGARRWLTAHPGAVTAVECGDVGDPTDLDTPADLAAWRAAHTR